MGWAIFFATFFVWALGGAYFGKKSSVPWSYRHEKLYHNKETACACWVWGGLGYPLWPIVYPSTLVFFYSGADRGDRKLRKQERELVRLKRSEEIVREGIKIQQETLKLTEQCNRTAEQALRQQASSSLDIGSLELSP